jgi:hypothetical protein
VATAVRPTSTENSRRKPDPTAPQFAPAISRRRLAAYHLADSDQARAKLFGALCAAGLMAA